MSGAAAGARRLEAVREALVRAGDDGEGVATHLLVTDPAGVRWLTGFSGSAGRVLVAPEGPAVLVTDDRYLQRAADEAPGAHVVIDRGWDWLAAHLPDGAALAVEADRIDWATVRLLQASVGEVVPTEGLLAGLRAVKDDEELRRLREACAVTVAVFDDVLDWLVAGVTERQVERFLVDRIADRGAEGPAFPAIVAAGPHGATPHHRPTDRPIGEGELVTLDFGARVDGMHADMTRTVAAGEPDARLRRIHDLVRAAQAAAVAAVAPGVTTRAVDAVARGIIADAGHGEDFRHGLGHGVGLEVHEQPFLGATSPGTLRERMTVTVEPGVYVPGLGGVRIEDVVLVGASGPERLTPAPHELIVL